jgi:hypothetical protein
VRPSVQTPIMPKKEVGGSKKEGRREERDRERDENLEKLKM